MVAEAASEVETLFYVVMDMRGEDQPVDFDHGLPAHSASLTERQVENNHEYLESVRFERAIEREGFRLGATICL